MVMENISRVKVQAASSGKPLNETTRLEAPRKKSQNKIKIGINKPGQVGGCSLLLASQAGF